MLFFRGAVALSDFRINKILSTIQTLAPAATSLHVEFIHFANLREELNPDEKSRLENLLQYGQMLPQSKTNGLLLLTIPRPGTISPWSSKATDIIHNCGIKKIQRIERGTAWYLTCNENPTTEIIEKIKSKIHDRMTEIVVGDFKQAELLFDEMDKFDVQ